MRKAALDVIEKIADLHHCVRLIPLIQGDAGAESKRPLSPETCRHLLRWHAAKTARKATMEQLARRTALDKDK